MNIRSFVSIIVLLSVVAVACTHLRKPPEQSEPDPPPPDKPVAQGPSAPISEPPVTPDEPALPFVLIIGEQTLGPDRKVHVPEAQGVTINFMSDDYVACELSVQHPGGETIMIGAWQSDMAQFYQSFPYGENHLFLTFGDQIYDILVVSGAPEPGLEDEGSCEGTLIHYNSDAQWEYEATKENELASRLIYRVQDWTVDSQGEVGFTLAMERRSGIEANVTGTVQADLVCSGKVILIRQAVEQDSETRWLTIYDDGTIYLPSKLNQDIWWERRGTLHVETGDEVTTYDIVERYQCREKERVSVEAGEFEAWRVDYSISQTRDDEEHGYSGASWYVEGLGRILNEADLEGAPRVELVSYEGIAPSR